MIDTIDKLKSKNFSAFVLHLTSAATLLYLYLHYKSEQFCIAKTYTYDIASAADILGTCSTGNQEPGQCNTEINFTKPKEVLQINIIYGALAFFLITAFAHYYYSTDGFHSGSYSRIIKQGWNPYRWAEFGISASLMTVLIGLVQGVRDTSTLSALAIMTGAMQMCGLVVESSLKYNVQPNRDTIYAATSAAWILFAGLWGILIYNFATIVLEVNDKYDDVSVPSWIWIVVFLQLIYYASFGVVQAVHLNRRLHDKSFKFEEIEHWYINLSFFAKLSLASGIGYGLIFRTKDCP